MTWKWDTSVSAPQGPGSPAPLSNRAVGRRPTLAKKLQLTAPFNLFSTLLSLRQNQSRAHITWAGLLSNSLEPLRSPHTLFREMSYSHGVLRWPVNNIKNLFSLLTGRIEYFWIGLISWYPMSDVQNEICITEEAVRGKTLQCLTQLFYNDVERIYSGLLMGATSSNLWASTPPNSFIHRPHSCPSFTSCQRFSLL